MVTTIKKPAAAPAPDQAGDASGFDDLTTQALLLDGGSAAPGAPAEPEPGELMATELFALLKLPRVLAQKRFTWWPEFEKVWSDDQLRAIAQSFAQLAVHMKWDMDEIMSRFGPWLGLIIAAGVPAFVTWDAIQQRREAIAAHQKAMQQQQRQTTAPPPNGNPQ
ncbi:MAG: hypothetical protein ABI433_07220 [Burkholderiaceae bacterium]